MIRLFVQLHRFRAGYGLIWNARDVRVAVGPPRRRIAAAIVGIAFLLALAGCADEDDRGTPAACQAPVAEVRAALRDAPQPVTVGGTRISECLTDQTDGGTLLDVGQIYVAVAVELADRAGRQPDGAAAVELGYLVGALGRDDRGAQGVGYELKRRIDSELLRVNTRSRAFRRGLRGGRETG